MIVISGDFLKTLAECPGKSDTSFFSLDGGDVFSNVIKLERPIESVPGTVYIRNDADNVDLSSVGKATDKVRVILDASSYGRFDSSVLGSVKAAGFVQTEFGWTDSPVQILPVREEIFSRIKGILETDALSSKKVFIAGLGSGGSTIAVELAKSGLTHFFIMDHDRIEIGNVARHEAGISDVGRFKTKVVAEKIHEKNPYAKVETWTEKICSENIEMVQEIVSKVDLVICATDNRPPKLILNRISVEENKPCMFAGVFRRAYGGQVQVVRPRLTPCYQCFLMNLPEQDQDQEVSSREQASDLAYTDRPVAIEPGLSIDIAPVTILVVKLAIQELLKGAQTTLASLDEDLVAPLFLWLNRREAGTQYEKLKPLEFNVSGMHILRWFGIAMDRVPDCPVCGGV